MSNWLVSALVVMTAGCASVSTEIGGFVAADGRVFIEPPKYPGQATGNGVSLVTEPRAEFKSGNSTLTLKPFYRLDPNDERRSHFDVREAKYRLSLEHFEFAIGSDVVTWGVLEAYRPTDVINQVDFVESFNGSAKLGQPMVELGWVGSSSSFKLYVLPYFRERTFPGVRGRLRFPATLDVDHPEYESPLRQYTPSAAARYAFNFGDLDVSLSAFGGVSRDPRFILELTTGNVAPRYDMSYQGSADAQLTLDALTLKVEGFVRLWTNQLVPFGGGGAGLDYTFYKVFDEANLTFAAEFVFDTRPLSGPITFFDHDAFAGARLAFNDVANTEINAGALVDVIDGATFGTLEASRRLGEHWRLTATANLFFGKPGKLQTSFVRDNFGQLRVAYFF